MSGWQAVVTHPLGLAGYALFLLFVLVARRTSSKQHRWITPLFGVMAVVALVGGLGLAYLVGPQQPQVQEPPSVSIQKTHGDQSPVVKDVKGNVEIRATQQGETGKKEEQKSPKKK